MTRQGNKRAIDDRIAAFFGEETILESEQVPEAQRTSSIGLKLQQVKDIAHEHGLSDKSTEWLMDLNEASSGEAILRLGAAMMVLIQNVSEMKSYLDRFSSQALDKTLKAAVRKATLEAIYNPLILKENSVFKNLFSETADTVMRRSNLNSETNLQTYKAVCEMCRKEMRQLRVQFKSKVEKCISMSIDVDTLAMDLYGTDTTNAKEISLLLAYEFKKDPAGNYWVNVDVAIEKYRAMNPTEKVQYLKAAKSFLFGEQTPAAKLAMQKIREAKLAEERTKTPASRRKREITDEGSTARKSQKKGQKAEPEDSEDYESE